jgi:hypothetical protein
VRERVESVTRAAKKNSNKNSNKNCVLDIIHWSQRLGKKTKQAGRQEKVIKVKSLWLFPYSYISFTFHRKNVYNKKKYLQVSVWCVYAYIS